VGNALHAAAATVQQNVDKAKVKGKLFPFPSRNGFANYLNSAEKEARIEAEKEAKARGEAPPEFGPLEVAELTESEASATLKAALTKEIQSEIQSANPDLAPQVVEALARQKVKKNSQIRQRLAQVREAFAAHTLTETMPQNLTKAKISSEQSFVVELDLPDQTSPTGHRKVLVRGVFDRIEVDTEGRVTLIDFKSRLSSAESTAGLSQTLQGLIYAWAYHRQFGVVPRRVVVRPLATKSSGKSGTHVERSFEPTLEDLAITEELLVTLTREMSNATLFPASPSAANCRGCGWASLCPVALRDPIAKTLRGTSHSNNNKKEGGTAEAQAEQVELSSLTTPHPPSEELKSQHQLCDD